MAFNWGQMFAELDLTILDAVEGVLTKTEDVPHAYDPSYTPKYELQVWDSEAEEWIIDYTIDQTDLVEMVDEAHYGVMQYRLTEDGLPVFIRG